MTTCLITGCRLVIPAEGKSLWGDLHEMGTVWVLNGVLHQHLDAHWEYPGCTSHLGSEKQCILREGVDYFERRGVVVIPKEHARLNQAAREYLA